MKIIKLLIFYTSALIYDFFKLKNCQKSTNKKFMLLIVGKKTQNRWKSTSNLKFEQFMAKTFNWNQNFGKTIPCLDILPRQREG